MADLSGGMGNVNFAKDGSSKVKFNANTRVGNETIVCASFNSTIPGPGVDMSLKADIDLDVDLLVTYGIVIEASLVPPQIDDIAVYRSDLLFSYV